MHARSALGRRSLSALAPAAVAAALVVAPAASAAETGTATFDKVSCTSGKHTVTLAAKNPSPSSATFTIRVDGPNVATPNTITVPANGSNTEKVSLPDDATKATVTDSSGNVIGTSDLACASSSSSSGASSNASTSAKAGGSGSAPASSATSTSTPSAADVAAPAPASAADSGSGTRKMIGIGVAALGAALGIALLIREFK